MVRHEVINPVRSAQVAALAGQLLHTLLPGLNWPSGHTIIASQLAPVYTGRSPVQLHVPATLSRVKVSTHVLQAPLGLSQAEQLLAQFWH